MFIPEGHAGKAAVTCAHGLGQGACGAPSAGSTCALGLKPPRYSPCRPRTPAESPGSSARLPPSSAPWQDSGPGAWGWGWGGGTTSSWSVEQATGVCEDDTGRPRTLSSLHRGPRRPGPPQSKAMSSGHRPGAWPPLSWPLRPELALSGPNTVSLPFPGRPLHPAENPTPGPEHVPSVPVPQASATSTGPPPVLPRSVACLGA